MISIAVSYAIPAKQKEIDLSVEADCTVLNAILQSGIITVFPEIKMPPSHVGINGKLVSLEAMLKEGDRIEIYRTLQRDPKELRRTKVVLKKTGK